MDTHVGVAGNRVHRHREKRACPLIQNDVVALGADHAVAPDPQHLGNLPAPQPCAVHHPAGLKHAVGRGDLIDLLVVVMDVRHLVVEEILHAVLHRVLRQRNGVLEGIHDAAVGRKHGKLSHHGRHQAVQLLLVDETQIPGAVHPALLDGPLERGHILLRVSHQHLSAAGKRDVQLPGQLVKSYISLHAAGRL